MTRSAALQTCLSKEETHAAPSTPPPTLPLTAPVWGGSHVDCSLTSFVLLGWGNKEMPHTLTHTGVHRVAFHSQPPLGRPCEPAGPQGRPRVASLLYYTWPPPHLTCRTFTTTPHLTTHTPITSRPGNECNEGQIRQQTQSRTEQDE